MDELPGYSPDDDLPGRRADEAPPPEPQDVVDEAVSRHFDHYDARRDGAVLTYYVEEPVEGFDAAFEALMAEIKPKGFIPILRQQGGENVLRVVPNPPVQGGRIFINVLLYLATWVTTTLAGAWTYFVYTNADFCVECFGSTSSDLALSQEALLGGFLFFAVPLMTILTVHEMGHYIASKKHGMTPSMPYFIPLPPIFAVNIGTLGAFISLREPIPSRRALLDIGASGPLAGLVIAIPVVLLGVGFMATSPVHIPADAPTASLGTPLLYTLLAAPFSLPADTYIHPTALAGWVGLLVTGINLLPAGQLDGGHIAASWLGKKAQGLSVAAVAALILLGIGWPPFAAEQVLPGYDGWLIFALLVLFIGAQHPPTLNDVTDLSNWRKWVAIGTLLLVFVTFTPVPIS